MPKEKKAKKADAKKEHGDAQFEMHEVAAIANVGLLGDMAQLKAKVLRQPQFNDVEHLLPLGIGEGASQEPFNLQSYKTSLRDTGFYSCSGNFWWGDFLSLGMPHIHSNVQSIKNVKAQFMTSASACDLKELVVQVDDITLDPLAQGVPFRLLSCEEFPWAYLQQVEEDIKADDQVAMDIHLKKMLTTKIEFRHFKSDKQRDHWMIDYREKLVGAGDAAARTPLQRAEEIAKKRKDILAVQDSKRRVGAKTVLEHIEREYEGINWAPSSDRVNFNSVDVLLTLFDRMCSDGLCREIVVRGEEYFAAKGDLKKSPFHSYSKLESVIKKGKTLKNVQWCLHQMLFVVVEKQLDAGEITSNNLTGKQRPGNVGLVDFWLYKRDLATQMQGVLVGVALEDPKPFRDQMEMMLGGHSSYSTWGEQKQIMMLSKACQQALHLLEEVAYKKKYDSKGIQDAVKSHQSPKDALTKDYGIVQSSTLCSKLSRRNAGVCRAMPARRRLLIAAQIMVRTLKRLHSSPSK
jgi:hypothetical protein